MNTTTQTQCCRVWGYTCTHLDCYQTHKKSPARLARNSNSVQKVTKISNKSQKRLPDWVEVAVVIMLLGISCIGFN